MSLPSEQQSPIENERKLSAHEAPKNLREELFRTRGIPLQDYMKGVVAQQGGRAPSPEFKELIEDVMSIIDVEDKTKQLEQEGESFSAEQKEEREMMIKTLISAEIVDALSRIFNRKHWDDQFVFDELREELRKEGYAIKQKKEHI